VLTFLVNTAVKDHKLGFAALKLVHLYIYPLTLNTTEVTYVFIPFSGTELGVRIAGVAGSQTVAAAAAAAIAVAGRFPLMVEVGKPWTADGNLRNTKEGVIGLRSRKISSSAYQIAGGVAAGDVAAADVAAVAVAAGSRQSYASPRSFDDEDLSQRQTGTTAVAAGGIVERSAVGFGSNVGTVDCCGADVAAAEADVAAAAVAVADVKTVRSDVAAAAAGDADADHVGRGGEWAAPRPPGQSFADCTAADSADGAGSCERAAAMRATSELQLSMHRRCIIPGQCSKTSFGSRSLDS